MIIVKGAAVPESAKLCVAYDRKDGRIVHIHQVVTFPGGAKLSESQVKARTLEIAAKRGLDTSKLGTLHVLPEHFDPMKSYKVDVKTGRLVKRSGAKARRSSGRARP
jgi:hypothetical protein